MTPYIRNSNCQCARCRAHGLMVSAILVTMGIIILLKNYGIVPIHESIPVIFLVVGGLLLVARTGSTEGHVQPGWIQPAGAQPPAMQPWTSGVTPPPPPSQPEQRASDAGHPSSSSDENDSKVKP